MNRLYFGDNLKWLSDRKEFPDASVDLVYLDPPFNSNAGYNSASPARTLFLRDERRGEPGAVPRFYRHLEQATPPTPTISSSTTARISPWSS